MFTTQKTFIKLISTGSFLTFAAACAQPQPVPIVADMYFDKFSAAQSASNGVEFCDLSPEDFTPALVAQIRSNPNYERNLAIWLEECPELALAFADFGTASIPSPNDAGGEGAFGEADGAGPNGPSPAPGPGPGPGPSNPGNGDTGSGNGDSGDGGNGDGGNGDGGKGGGGNGDGGKGGGGKGGGNGNSSNTNGNSGNSQGNGGSDSNGNQGNGSGNNGNGGPNK